VSSGTENTRIYSPTPGRSELYTAVLYTALPEVEPRTRVIPIHSTQVNKQNICGCCALAEAQQFVAMF